MIGIVGGMGPYAGLDLAKKIFDNTRAESDREHLDVALLSLPSSIGDRTEYLESKSINNPANGIVNVLIKLQDLGAAVAGIPCNTAHCEPILKVIMEQLNQRKATIKLINMIERTVAYIKNDYPDIKTVGVLATKGTYSCGVYENALKKEGYNTIPVPLNIRQRVHDVIYNAEYGIKSIANPVHPKAIEKLFFAVDFLQNEGAELIILGCTELPLAITQSRIDKTIFVDPTNILAKSLIEETNPDKLCV